MDVKIVVPSWSEENKHQLTISTTNLNDVLFLTVETQNDILGIYLHKREIETALNILNLSSISYPNICEHSGVKLSREIT